MVDLASKRQGLTSVLQQQQLQKQQIQQQEISLNDQKAGSEAMKNWNGQSLDDLPGLYIKHGASANAVLKLKTDIQDYTSKKTTQQKAQLENEKQLHDNMAGGLDAITSLPAAAQADALEKFKMNPDAVQSLDPAQRVQFAQTLDELKRRAVNGEDISGDLQRLKNEHLAESQINANAMSQQDLATKKQELADKKLANEQGQAKLDAQKAWLAKPENAGKTSADFDVAQEQAKAEAQAKGKITGEQAGTGDNGMPPTKELQDTKYLGIQYKKARGQKLSPEESAYAKSYEGQRTLVGTTNFNLQNGGQLSPDTIDALGKGQVRWSDLVSARTPMSVKSAILSEVKAKYPDFNSGDFDVEKKVKETATSGTVGQQLLAIGTARQHMQLFGELADALDNGNVQLLNKIGNTFGIQFGSDKATNLKIAAQAFGGEVGKAFDGAGVVASERESAQKAYEDYLSKGQFKGAVQTVDKLLAGKQKAAHEWFDKGTQAKPNFGEGEPKKTEISSNQPAGATHIGIGSVDKKKHYLDASGKDLGLAE